MSRREQIEQVWERVDAALDRREDPLQDPWLQRSLAQEPALRAEVERLQQRLGLLAQEPFVAPTVERRSAFAFARAASILVLIGAATWATFAFMKSPAERSPGVVYEFAFVVQEVKPAEPVVRRVVHEASRVVAWDVPSAKETREIR